MIMGSLLIYMLKFSITIAVLSLFYLVLLRKLTFYNLNRIYLIAVVVFALILPVVDVSELIPGESPEESGILNGIPAVGNISLQSSSTGNSFDTTALIFILLMAGTLILLVRLLIQYIFLIRLKRNSVLVHLEKGLQVFDTDHAGAPFTFASGIYIKRSQYSAEEAQKIIEHESMHVRGFHTADIILSEVVCILNWFNPFAWMLRRYIRQNLEFIADEAVLSRDADKKSYQYLLLRSSADFPSILVNTFSAENLKKRIVMMNTTNSSKTQLLRFFALVPVFLFISILFREGNIAAQSTETVTMEAESGIEIRSSNSKDKPQPLYIIDGVMQPADFDIKTLKSEDIIRITVWKGDEAVKKFGAKAKPGGVISIETRLAQKSKKK